MGNEVTNDFKMGNEVTNDIKIVSKNKEHIEKFIRNSFAQNGNFYYYYYHPQYKYINKRDSIQALCLNKQKKYSPIDLGNLNNYIKESINGNYILKFSLTTRGASPKKIIENISKKHKKLKIKVKYADEDIGFNCGIYTIKNEIYLKNKIAPSLSEQKKENSIYKWLKFASKLVYDCHPAHLGYDINGKVCTEIEKNPEEYIKKIKNQRKIEKNIKRF